MKIVSFRSPQGKLLRIRARVEDGKVFGVQVSGNFFLAPHNKLVNIEEALEGFVASDTDACVEVLEYVLQRDRIRIAGFEVADVAHTLSLFGGAQ